MKKTIFRTGALLIALILLLTGCAAGEPEPEGVADEGQSYRERITELEAELQKAREEQFITNSQHLAEIKELQKQLALLRGDAQTGGGSTENAGEITFLYQLQGDNAIVTGVQGDATLLSIPKTLDGHPVVGIGERALENRGIVAVILPEGLEAIGWFAFYGCSSLMDVTIPASVTSIGYAVFDGCPNLSITCPADSFAERYAESYGLPHITT